MKLTTLLLLISALTSAFAVELKFIGPCEEDFLMRTDVAGDFANVGELTVTTLAKFGIPFNGTAEGLASAFETPTGDAAVEVISNEELRAYGWCFTVDGVSPEVYPSEVPVTSETKSVVWHFGFARFFKGQWVTQCTPAWTIKPAFLCKDSTAESTPAD